MSANWPEILIEELKAPTKNAIAMGPFGSRIKADNFVETGIPVIKGGNLNGDFILENSFSFLTVEKADELISSNAYRRDIVITHRGTIGQVGIIPDNSKYERYVVSQSQLKVSLDQERVNPYFVYYFLRSPEGQHRLLMNASQVGVPAIAQASTSVKAILVPCPDKKIQDQVVENLLNLDHKIQLNRQINKTLEEVAQAIFKSWFVDFEPVKAKIEAKANDQNPERAAMCAISGKTNAELDQLSPDQLAQLRATAALFPDELVESELGLIPKGWRYVSFGSVVKIFDSKRVPLSKKQRQEKQGTYPYYGATSVMDYVDDYLFDGTYILMAEDGSVMDKEGYPTIQYVWGKFWVNNHAHILKGAEGISDENIMLFLKNTLIAPYITGAVQLKINQKNMKSIPFLKGTDNLHQLFAETIQPLFDGIKNRENEIAVLVDLRDTLLPKLLSGEIDLSGNAHLNNWTR